MDSLITIISFGFFLIIFLWVGAFAAKFSQNTDSDYLLANRSFGKYFIALSAGATANSGYVMTGIVGLGYSQGISGLLFLLAFFIGELIFWNFFPDKINQISLEQNSQTVPELIGSTLKTPQGKKLITSIVALISVVFVGLYTAAQFYASAKILNAFFGINLKIGAVISFALILAYCVKGGLRASVWTDVVQAIVVIFVCFGTLIAATIAGGSIPEIITKLYSIDPQLTNIFSGFTWWTIIAYILGFIFGAIGFSLSQPQYLVRLMAGRNPNEVKQAKWLYLFFGYSTSIAMLLFGMICRISISDINDPEQALPLYAVQNFHPFFIGIVLAGVFSIIASTADSQIVVCSSSLAKDVSPPLYRQLSTKYGLKYQQFITIMFGILAVSATNFITSTVFSLIIFSTAGLAGSISPAMFITVLKIRTHYLILISTIFVGLFTAIAWRFLGYHQLINEALPAFLIALLFHEIFMRIRKQKIA